MHQISESIFVHQDTCNVYVVRSGRAAVLIDCGDGSVLDQLPAIGVDQVTDVLMTHHHRDQGQGLPRLVDAGARIHVPEAEQDLFQAVDRHLQSREVVNSYNNREDRFSILTPVPVAGILQDYRYLTFGAHSYYVLATPGHTTGSISLLAQIDGQTIVFAGDLVAGPGQVWSLAATQWSYNGGEGIAGSILSLLDLKDQSPTLLLPSHGQSIDDPVPAIDLTIERLSRLRDLRGQNPRLFVLREEPYKTITPHLLMNRTSMSNAYVLLSESGKALLIDFGYDFMFGAGNGFDRASRRPWLQTIPALKRQFGVTAVDVVLPTHFHDDHVAGINLLRSIEGTQVWAPDRFADVLEHPERYDLPCLWYDPIPVDRTLPMETPVRWEEYEFTLHPLSGHTYYSVAISFEVDGKRVLATGDQQGNADGWMLNYVYKNGFRPADHRESGELYQRLQPELIITGHWEPHWVEPGYLDRLLERGIELEQLHQELLWPDEFGLTAVIRPYRVVVMAGDSVRIEVVVTAPGAPGQEARFELALPTGWKAWPEASESQSPAVLRLDADGRATAAYMVQPTPVPVDRAWLAADITIGGRRLGQRAEAVVTVVLHSTTARS